ncbi:PHD-finger domain-containing protein, partial [Toxoplasma gondii MAS]
PLLLSLPLPCLLHFILLSPRSLRSRAAVQGDGATRREAPGVARRSGAGEETRRESTWALTTRCLDFQSFTCRGRTKLPRQRRRAVRCSLFHRRCLHAPRCLSPLTLPVLPSPRSRLRRHLSRSKSGFTRRPRLARPSETQPRQRVCEDGRRRRQQARRRSDSERFQVARWPRRVEAISCRRSSVRVTRAQLSAPPATSERPPAARSKTADTARWNPGSFTRRAVSKKRDSSASPPDACSTAFGPKGNSQTSSRPVLAAGMRGQAGSRSLRSSPTNFSTAPATILSELSACSTTRDSALTTSAIRRCASTTTSGSAETSEELSPTVRILPRSSSSLFCRRKAAPVAPPSRAPGPMQFDEEWRQTGSRRQSEDAGETQKAAETEKQPTKRKRKSAGRRLRKRDEERSEGSRVHAQR